MFARYNQRLIYDCLPSENINDPRTGFGSVNDGYNTFCNSKDSTKQYCDPNLKKCEPCSIVNNVGYDPTKTPLQNSGKPNPTDCGVNPDDLVTIGRCDLASGASVGGDCRRETTCTLNTDCSSSCCSAVPQTSGPERVPTQPLANKCIKPNSPNNPLSSLISPINSYLCKNA